MRDLIVRRFSAGLIFTFPVLVHVASATSVASADAPRFDSVAAAVLGLVEVVLAGGLMLASGERKRLGVG
jgi:hypothetical protein